jgi:hypothetical protein
MSRMLTPENTTKTAPPEGHYPDFDELVRPKLIQWVRERDRANEGVGFGPRNDLFTDEEWEAERQFAIERQRYRLWIEYTPIFRALLQAQAEYEQRLRALEASRAYGEVAPCPECNSSQLYCQRGHRVR